MEAPEPTTAAARACLALRGALPATVESGHRRTTTPDSPYVAAWGDPPITLRCGVDRPAGYRPGVDLVTVNGIAWLPEPTTGGYLFTTVGRVAQVEVAVARAYAPEVNPLTELATAVGRTVPCLRAGC